MDPRTDKQYIRIRKNIAIVAVLVVAAGLMGWQFGRSETPRSVSNPTNVTQSAQSAVASAGSVDTVASYTLPDGWKQTSCEGNGSVFVVPNGATSNCGEEPISPVKISIDPGNNTDCNQLQNQSDVKKHICISQYINGNKSLKATTEFLAASSYKKATTINAYYIDTGKAVVKVEYIYNSDNEHQSGFDQLANSVKAK